MIKKSMLIWLAIIPLAILNGGLRDRVVAPLIGAQWALPISGITLCLMILVIGLVFIPRIGRGAKKDYMVVGLVWLVLTVLFETVLALAGGMTPSGVIKAYDITTGNLWLVVVVFTGVTPFLVAKIKRLI